MRNQVQFIRFVRRAVCRAALACTAIFIIISAAIAQEDPESSSEMPQEKAIELQMSETLRSSIEKVVVIAGQSPRNDGVTGSYENPTYGLIDGMEAGSRMGTITKEIGGVPINIPIPGLAIPGAIFGGLSGAYKREIQEFRDELTEEIANADSPSLISDGLALDAFWGIRKLPQFESQLFAPSVEISADTDAVLYVSINDLTIDVQDDEAIISASAFATLRRLSDGMNVYETVIRYQDRDTLKNWTKNDNALWRSFTNFARFYLGREIAADVFDRVLLAHDLRPIETDTSVRAEKNERKFNSNSPIPTLAWELKLDGGNSQNSWASTIDEADIFYDIEIFDNRQLVYYEESVPDPSHTLAYELADCQTYRWSVRPSYHVDGAIKFGEWMRFQTKPNTESEPAAGKGIFGRQASVAPAYTQDFALLEIDCIDK
jgi:hypothetical protein